MAPGEGETAIVEQAVRGGSAQLVSATVWESGEGPRKFDPNGPSPPTGIRWFDIGPSATPGGLLELLGPICPGLEREMLDDLLAPDEIPENRRWDGGKVRLASTFVVYPAVAEGLDWAREVKPSATAVYQEVEMLAGADWLISVWHDAHRYCGKKPNLDLGRPVGKAQVFAAVEKRWWKTGGRNAGDLGVLVMHELALTYAPAHRHCRAALEEWEMGLYGSDGELTSLEVDPKQDRELRELWDARARLRDWLSPLNVIGINEDLDRAWLPAADHDQVKAVDKRVDRALDVLGSLGDTLRGSFHLLYIKTSEAQRERHEKLQRRVELIAAAFLVPTLIVGFFGANTWVPGEHRHWGLTIMLGAMAILTCTVMALLWATHRRYDFRPGRARRLARQKRQALR
jgi:CorA-like Mg2+ transporter protein